MKNITAILLVSLVVVSCGSDSALTYEQVEQYTNQGARIAEASFKALNAQLKVAIQVGGINQATSFCNAVAMPQTDSLSKQYGAVIKRTSLKLRNPSNAPDSMEVVMLKVYLQMSRMRNPVLVPKILIKNETEIQFFSPIVIKDDTCLKCHGVIGDSMKKKDYAFIKQHYPNDEAVDYKLDQLRGMWSITLKR